MRLRLTRCSAILVACAAVIGAQTPNWTLTIPQVLYPLGKYIHPFARLGSASVYDTFQAQVTLFGGLVASSNGPLTVNDMWISAKGAWLQIHPSLLPPARFCAASAYDYHLGEMRNGGLWRGRFPEQLSDLLVERHLGVDRNAVVSEI